MKLSSNSFIDGQAITGEYAFCIPDVDNHVTFSANRNPHLAWTNLPAGGDDVNQEGREVPADLPRVDFTHWVLVDLQPDRDAIAEGEFSTSVTAGGKDGPDGPDGTRQGINDYTDWFAGDADMAGDYYGYDGPCPPWNDTIFHHYHFTLYALDISRCPVAGRFGRQDVLDAIEGHVLGQASVTGIYSLNPGIST